MLLNDNLIERKVIFVGFKDVELEVESRQAFDAENWARMTDIPEKEVEWCARLQNRISVKVL